MRMCFCERAARTRAPLLCKRVRLRPRSESARARAGRDVTHSLCVSASEALDSPEEALAFPRHPIVYLLSSPLLSRSAPPSLGNFSRRSDGPGRHVRDRGAGGMPVQLRM